MPHLELIFLNSESADGCKGRIVRHVASSMQVNTLSAYRATTLCSPHLAATPT